MHNYGEIDWLTGSINWTCTYYFNFFYCYYFTSQCRSIELFLCKISTSECSDLAYKLCKVFPFIAWLHHNIFVWECRTFFLNPVWLSECKISHSAQLLKEFKSLDIVIQHIFFHQHLTLLKHLPSLQWKCPYLHYELCYACMCNATNKASLSDA